MLIGFCGMVSGWIDLLKLDKYENWTILWPKPSLLPLSGPNHFLCTYTSLNVSYFHWVLESFWRGFDISFDTLGLTLDNRRNDEFHTKIKIRRTFKNHWTSFENPFVDDFLSFMFLWRNGKLYQNTKWEQYWAAITLP